MATGTNSSARRQQRRFLAPFRITGARGFRLTHRDPGFTAHPNADDKPEAGARLARSIAELEPL